MVTLENIEPLMSTYRTRLHPFEQIPKLAPGANML
jgi:hypothetical protein